MTDARFDAAAFFRRYADDRRQQAVLSFDREDLGHLVRYTARSPQAEGFVVFASLDDGWADDEIRAQCDHFAARSQAFEWKVYDFDRPADLVARLNAAGFVAGEAETLMTCDTTTDVRAPRGDVDIRRVDESGLDDVVAILEAVWPGDVSWLRGALARQMGEAPATLSIFCAYRAGLPVATGWIDYPPGSRFPELRGGAVLPAARGLGFYRALLDVRLREAVDRGYAWLCVDALPTSRPILEAIGFVPVCTTTPMRMRGGATDVTA